MKSSVRTLTFVLLILSAFFSVAAEAPEVRTIWTLNRRYTNLSDLAKRYRMQFSRGNSSWNFGNRFGMLKLYPDKRDARFNNVRIIPSFAPLLRNGVAYLSAVDVNTLLNPFFTTKKPHKHKIYRIVIDPGHGGKDHGAIGRITREKNITLQLAKMVEKSLEASGYAVTLTRTSDVYLGLSERPARANRADADLFLSLHVNAAADRSITGIETYALTPAGAPSSSSSTPTTAKVAGNEFDFNNILLAYYIQKTLLERTGAIDRGVKRARFAVLRDLKCPGVLVEIGFISNSAEERKLASTAYLDRLAKAISSGVIAYHRSLSQ